MKFWGFVDVLLLSIEDKTRKQNKEGQRNFKNLKVMWNNQKWRPKVWFAFCLNAFQFQFKYFIFSFFFVKNYIWSIWLLFYEKCCQVLPKHLRFVAPSSTLFDFDFCSSFFFIAKIKTRKRNLTKIKQKKNLFSCIFLTFFFLFGNWEEWGLFCFLLINHNRDDRLRAIENAKEREKKAKWSFG